jgi:hypothetical protein
MRVRIVVSFTNLKPKKGEEKKKSIPICLTIFVVSAVITLSAKGQAVG